MDSIDTTLSEKDFGALASIGFGAERRGDLLNRDALIPARITAVHRDRCAAWTARGGGLVDMHLRLSPALSDPEGPASSRPAVGDWVLARPVEGLDGREGLTGLAVAILPRRGILARKEAGLRQQLQVLAANVDLALIVAAAGRDFNPRRIERYLALAWEGEVNPLIVLTKMDLAEDPGALVAEAEALAFGVPVIPTSSVSGEGLEALAARMGPGGSSALLGSSGAGKSSLLNALAGYKLADTGEVREDDQRGRHTTTHRELFALASGALVIDTPGLREIQLWAEGEAVDGAFADIEELAASCRFRDCSHQEEPGCAVRAALEEGSLDAGRHASWRKLRREVAWLDRREDASLARAERERWRAINQSMRGYTKERRSIQGSSR